MNAIKTNAPSSQPPAQARKDAQKQAEHAALYGLLRTLIELSDTQLQSVASGLNPQPLPPGHTRSPE